MNCYYCYDYFFFTFSESFGGISAGEDVKAKMINDDNKKKSTLLSQITDLKHTEH